MTKSTKTISFLSITIPVSKERIWVRDKKKKAGLEPAYLELVNGFEPPTG